MRSRGERKKSVDISELPTPRRSERRSRKSPSLPNFDIGKLVNSEYNSKIAQGKEIYTENVCKENEKILIESKTDNTSKNTFRECTKKFKKDKCNTDLESDMIPIVYERGMFSKTIQNDASFKIKLSDSSNIITSSRSLENVTSVDAVSNDLKLETQLLDIRPIDNTILKDVKTLEENCFLKDNLIKSRDIGKRYLIHAHKTTENGNIIPAKEEKCLKKDIPKKRKRKWISKKQVQAEILPVLSISTDSLKTIISDVKPVPLTGYIKLDSSSEVEFYTDGEHSDQSSKNVKIFTAYEKPLLEQLNLAVQKSNESVGIKHFGLNSPSPSKNNESNILYITNLVRPFTVLQLKGLLARTGKIRLDGFWIDRIKSKCYVQYETADEAIETRHALHGIRWPASNPKCLNVDFGKTDDMQRAITSTKEDTKKYNNDGMEHTNISTFFSKDDKKVKPVREWDLGKNNLDGQNRQNAEKNRINKRDKEPVIKSLEDEENDNKIYDRKTCNNSISPARNIERKNIDPPLRLLDDLFRKTRTTPCIYWLPLTPEQIGEKDLNRKKRFNEQHQRLQQGDIGVVKVFTRERNREYEKHQRFKESNECRESRSRDNRRY